jgi:uncharacterized tellurite resistance protein B-like protein
MAQLIALLGAVAGLIWAVNALQKAGVPLNPLAWWRRFQWREQHGTKPLYRLRDPGELAVVLLLGTAKCKGDVTATQKAKLRELCTQVIKLPEAEVDDLVVAAAFMLRDEVYLVDNLESVLLNTRRQLSGGQKASILNMMEDVAAIDGPANAEQRRLIDRTMTLLNQRD